MDNKAYVKRLLLTIGIILTLLLVLYAFHIILLIFAGGLLAVFLHGLSRFLRKYVNLPEELCLTLVIILIICIVASCTWFFGREIATKVNKFDESLQNAYRTFITQVQRTEWGAQLLKEATSGVSNSSGFDMLSKITDIFTTTMGTLFDIFIIVFMGLFLAYEHRMYTRGFKSIFPKRYQQKVEDLLTHIGHVLRWWMFGQFMYMLAIGVLSTIGLWIMGIPLALSLGIFAMLMSFVPYLGSILSAIPAMLIALTISNQMVLYVFILYMIIHMIDAYFLAPLIQLEAISLPPALTIGSQILMAYLAGGLGLLLATPLTAVIIVLVQVLYLRDVLGKEVVLIGQHHID
ncbi:MAG TPA: AI-2E family transporter [Balneolaceae bacterium]|nr:AI-2E family transporter [Balneolaceae bacterium]